MIQFSIYIQQSLNWARSIMRFLQATRLPSAPCSQLPCSAIEMQRHITRDELDLAIAAFAIPSAYCILRIVCFYLSGKQTWLIPSRLDEVLHCSNWLVSGTFGITLATLAARTRDVRFLFGLKGVDLVSVLVLEVLRLPFVVGHR
jgi:hypothetical protein